jgi:hypothetical protein
MRQAWTEYQVVVGRKILFRGDLRSQAETFCADNGYILASEQSS